MVSASDVASHCFAFEQDFICTWRCIPLCVRRKLDLIGLKLKLNHWLALTQEQRQVLVDWPDEDSALVAFRDHLRRCTATMPDGVAADLREVAITADRWAALSELDRYALCKLVRPGHDHHNLQAAFSEGLG